MTQRIVGNEDGSKRVVTMTEAEAYEFDLRHALAEAAAVSAVCERGFERYTAANRRSDSGLEAERETLAVNLHKSSTNETILITALVRLHSPLDVPDGAEAMDAAVRAILGSTKPTPEDIAAVTATAAGPKHSRA